MTEVKVYFVFPCLASSLNVSGYHRDGSGFKVGIDSCMASFWSPDGTGWGVGLAEGIGLHLSGHYPFNWYFFCLSRLLLLGEAA